MTYISLELRRQVGERAGKCCEYCLLDEEDNYIAHEVDHILSTKHRGTTTLDNLCLSCFDCNRYKGSDVGSFDTETDTFTPLFNPRTMIWDEHFKVEAGHILPLTPEGRVTGFLLRFNSAERVNQRRMLMREDRYPCKR